MPKLVWTEEGKSSRLELTGPATFGRGPDNTIVLADKNLSRHHGIVQPDGQGGWWVQDRDSSNGILVNGRREIHTLLSNGATFTAGGVSFTFEGPESSGLDRTVPMAIPAAAPKPLPSPAGGFPPVPATPSSTSRNALIAVFVTVAAMALLAAAIVFFRRSTDAARNGGGISSVFDSEGDKLRKDLASQDPTIRWAAYKKLKASGSDPDPVPLWILDLKGHPDHEVRQAAAEKLEKVRDRRAIPQLRWSHKHDDNFGVRRHSGNALEAMGIDE